MKKMNMNNKMSKRMIILNRALLPLQEIFAYLRILFFAATEAQKHRKETSALLRHYGYRHCVKYSALSLCVIGFALLTNWYQSIYDLSVKTIEGPQQPLSAYQGKKMLFITLPLVRTNAADSFLISVDSLGDANETTLKIITTPAFEDGYTNNQKQALKNWYRLFLDSSIVITTGMYTRKSSGNQQDEVFKWLTFQSRNGYMNEDVDGPMNKFMVRANGELMGALKARSKIGGGAMQRMLGTQ